MNVAAPRKELAPTATACTRLVGVAGHEDTYKNYIQTTNSFIALPGSLEDLTVHCDDLCQCIPSYSNY